MKVNELEEQLNIDRANIRFYEREGLLHPKRSANGYREYSEEDVSVLKKIIIFRKLGLPISEIREILGGIRSLNEAIEKNIENLNQQIKELNGALEVCKVISKDISSEFNEEYYWELIHEKETGGQQFFEFVKDYIEFEKHSLLRTYGGDSFYDSEGKVKQNGFKIALGILIGACILRGIFVGFIWKTGSFWSGALYPFFLLAIISLSMLPIFYVQRKYKDIEVEEEPVKYSKWKTVLKIVGAILFVPFCMIGIPVCIESVITGILGKNFTYVMTQDLYGLYSVAVLCLFVMLLFLYSKHGVFQSADGEGGIKARLPRKIKRKVLFYGMAMVFVVLLVYTFWFDMFTEDGAVKQRLFFRQEYTWDDVAYYTLENGTDGILEYVVVMEDGARLKCMGGSSASSNFPEDKYSDGAEDYCRHLTELFTERGIELRVDDWEKLYEKLDYEYWVGFAKEIRELANE